MEAQRALLGLFLIFSIIQSTLAQQTPLSSGIEWSALRRLRSSLGISAKDWPLKVDPCSRWLGIECQNGRVVSINVSGRRRTHYGRSNPQFSVDSLANFSLLVSFNSSGFALPGSIPDWFGQLLRALQVLDLRSSSVIGPIPASLGNLTRLNSLYLSDNSLTGIIPSALGQLSGLSVLDLSRNLLTGSVPAGLSSLRNLTRLDLSSNFLSGMIPFELGNLFTLQLLNLSNNSIAGPMPNDIGSLSQLIELDLGDNNIEGSLPEDDQFWGSFSQLQFVVLSGNKFDGALPYGLLSMPKLRFLDVSSNNFTGPLPNSSFNVNASEAVFNLSNNLFYGGLVMQLGKFSLIDLSGNFLQGKVPNNIESNANISRNCLQTVQNQRSLEDCGMFYADRGLTFDNFGRQDSSQPHPVPKRGTKSNKKLKFILAGVFGGLGFIVALVVVMLLLLRMYDKGIANHRGSANVGPVPVPEAGSPQLPKVPINLSGLGESFTYEQMLRYTGDFSETNLIKHGHSGDIFRGVLESGIPVVIKRVNLHSFKKESYMLELDLFNKVSHTRLVPLLGHCLEDENQKLLVYKYMPNGDLSNSLHRCTNLEDDGLQSLDWITRLKIAIGVAEGLSYLHHECTPPLVHRDVQASSILLDDKFEVRLGSLSEVHVQEGDPHQNAITRLLRMPQTSEQNPSGSSSATCAYDVYCFGKVLLELVTGKVGISKLDDGTTKEWLEHMLPCISMYDKELVTKIVDPSLIVDEDLLEEVWAMAIVARSCLNPKPAKRPLMRYILKALENPLKVVREEHSSSARLRTTSSRRSWSAAVFGSWRLSSSECATATAPGQLNREGISGLRQSGRVSSHGSAGNEYSSSHKRLSNEIFPEPVEMQDVERQDEH